MASNIPILFLFHSFHHFEVVLARFILQHRIQDIVDGLVLFLHFLVMTSALIGSPCFDELGHFFENLISSPHLFLDEIIPIGFKENVVKLFFNGCPMPNISRFQMAIFLLESFLFVRFRMLIL